MMMIKANTTVISPTNATGKVVQWSRSETGGAKSVCLMEYAMRNSFLDSKMDKNTFKINH